MRKLAWLLFPKYLVYLGKKLECFYMNISIGSQYVWKYNYSKQTFIHAEIADVTLRFRRGKKENRENHLSLLPLIPLKRLIGRKFMPKNDRICQNYSWQTIILMQRLFRRRILWEKNLNKNILNKQEILIATLSLAVERIDRSKTLKKTIKRVKDRVDHLM